MRNPSVSSNHLAPASPESDVSSLRSEERIQFAQILAIPSFQEPAHPPHENGSQSQQSNAGRQPEQPLDRSFTIARKPLRPTRQTSLYTIVSQRSDESNNSSPEKCLRSSSTLQVWWPELLAFTASLGCLLGIVGLLIIYQHKAMSEWPYAITPNTSISILSTTMRLALAYIFVQGLSQLKWNWFSRSKPLNDAVKFDNGSRGPIGALELLFMLRGRSLVASVGALSIFLLIAVDAFGQQLVQYSPCQTRSQKLTAESPRAAIFQEATLADHISPGLQAACNTGLYTSNNAVAAVSCPSGNCKFSNLYHTVGYCSICHDVSDDIIVTMINETDATVSNSTLPSGTFVTTSNPTRTTDRFFTINPIDNNFEFLFGANSPVWNDNNADPVCSNPGTKDSWYCKGIGAASCNFQPCIRTYSLEVVAGVSNEKLVSTSTEWKQVDGQDFLSSVYVPCLDPDQIDAARGEGYAITNDTTWFSYNRSIDPATGEWSGDSNNRDIIPKSCVYQMSVDTNNNIQNYMVNLLNGSVAPSGASFTAPPQISAFYNSSLTSFRQVQSKMSRIADSITDYMRNNAVTGFDGKATGTVYQEDICIDASWPWLAFPVTLVVLVTIFLLGTLILSRPATIRGEVYKSSPLPSIFHRLDRSTMTAHNIPALSQATHFEQASKNICARLRPGLNGWQSSAMVEKKKAPQSNRRP